MKHTNLLNSIAIIALVGAIVFVAIQLHLLTVRVSQNEADVSAVTETTMSYEDQLNFIGASLAISEPVPLFEDALAAKIDANDTSFTLISGTDKTGTSLASSTYGFILSEGSANEEFVLADCTGTACTNVERGYWPLTAATSSSLAKTHRRGDTVKITDSPIINEMKRIINGQDNFPNALTFDGKLTYSTQPTLTSTLDIPYKDYVDNSSNQGAATSTASIGGILEIATALETASTTTDLPDRPLALTTGVSTSTPNYGCDGTSTAGKLCVAVADSLGNLWKTVVGNLDQANTWAEAQTFGKSIIGHAVDLTDGATVDVDWSAGNTQEVVLGGNRNITFSNVTTGTGMTLFLCQDGTGSRTISSWPSEMRWQFGSAPTLTTTADKCDIISLRTSTSTNTVFGGIAPNF